MPVYVAQIVQKGTVRDATARHDGSLVSVACHRAPLAAQPLATCAWEGPGRHVGGCAGARVQSGSLPRQAPCRGNLSMNTYVAGGPGPFRFGGGRRSHEEQIEAKHTSSLPSFGALRRDNTPTAACLSVLSSCSGALSATVHTSC